MKNKFTLNYLIELIFPRQCLNCQLKGHDLCPACRLKLRQAPQFCPICLKRSKLGFICQSCKQKKDSPFYEAIYVYSNSEQKLVLHCLKSIRQKGQKNLAYILGKVLSKKILAKLLKVPGVSRNQISIIPWPLSKLAKRQRGYNQNEIIAQGFNDGQLFNISSQSLVVSRKKLESLKWRGEEKCQATAIVISDYLESDRLLNLAAKKLKAVGAKQVIFIALSREL